MKKPRLCPICKKEIKERKNCFTPIYCCKKHYLQATHPEGADDAEPEQEDLAGTTSSS